MLYRQGDVLVIATNDVPQSLKPAKRDKGRLVLAYGEVTGHLHQVIGEAELFTTEDLSEMADRFLRVESESQVVHDEHSTITLPAGSYVVRRQREYSPERLRVVAD